MSTIAIEELEVSAYTIPTDAPESDGTLSWDATTLILVRARAADREGLGYTYAHASTAYLVRDFLAPIARGEDAFHPRATTRKMVQAVRNFGRGGACAMAISAVDNALWDLKARLLELPLHELLGAVRAEVPVYASGGFCSYTLERLVNQLGGWVAAGFPRVKMKVGRRPDEDPARVAAVREVIGDDPELLVDANGAYGVAQALELSHVFAEEFGVRWLEEPRPSDEIAALRLLRRESPAGMEIAAGEYGFLLADFERLLAADAVDVLMPDVTRCLGITGFLEVAVLAKLHGIPLSAHCAPAQTLHVACAVPELRHLEFFHDHVRIETLLFDGVREPENGILHPDPERPGNGLELRKDAAQTYGVLDGG